MRKRSGNSKVRLVPKLSSYHSELQKRVAIIGVSLVIILVLVGLGLYVKPEQFVGKVGELNINNIGLIQALSGSGYNNPSARIGAAEGSEEGGTDSGDLLTTRVSTDKWDGEWSLDFRTGYCPGENFCVANTAPPQITAPRYCYAPGSIINNNGYYCAQTFGGQDNVWVVCNTNTPQYTLTEDSTFICDETNEWTQCTDEGDVRGNFRCDATGHWRECGDGTGYLCAGRETPLECKEDTKYQPMPELRDDGSAILTPNKYYCSYTPTGATHYKWIACTDDTKGEGVDNADNDERYGDNYVCDGTQWRSIISQCTACAGDRPGECIGSSAIHLGTGVTLDNYYSYSTTTANNQVARRIGCVSEDSSECFYTTEFAVDEKLQTASPSTDPKEICSATNNQWLRCSGGGTPISSENSRWIC
ncbi:MAG: hypothetical protein Q7K45_05690, partial [Nanoarchaeota archaeon]|nr:hypothetical protein [Nanoarchaeota archaeon]